MKRHALPLAVVLGALALPGCSTDQLTGANCVVNASGNKLCGDTAKGWCQEFAQPIDQSTVDACNSVGVDIGPVDDSLGFGQ